jgi:hypothetical protein
MVDQYFKSFSTQTENLHLPTFATIDSALFAASMDLDLPPVPVLLPREIKAELRRASQPKWLNDLMEHEIIMERQNLHFSWG